jgi:ribosomal protein S18 acetylase RimI-like enzyme
MDFHRIEENLREMFRSLAVSRLGAEVRETEGVTIVSLGAAFQMFNSVFLSTPVDDEMEFQRRIAVGARFMMAKGLPWSFWLCEDWLTARVRKRATAICAANGLHLASEMPGMAIERMKPSARKLPDLEYVRVTSERDRRDFCAIGSHCFHVPSSWFEEVFDSRMKDRPGFDAWQGYLRGEPVATAATVIHAGAIGLYNVAVTPEYRRRGYGEAVMRHAVEEARRRSGLDRVILQSTRQAVKMYERMGFSTVTRILAFAS